MGRTHLDYGHWDTAKQKGGDLEQRVAAHFVRAGYEVQSNVILTGRSGGRHEIDVLATKRDGLVTFRLMVECKHQGAPVSKDVVAKTKLVRDDCAIDKAMIVCPAGFALGAGQQARDLGIDLWQGRELDDAPAAALPIVSGQGILHAPDRARAHRWVDSQRRGFFSKEQVVGAFDGFLECHLFDIDYTVTAGGRFSKKIVTVRHYACYDGLEGTHGATFQADTRTTVVSSAQVLRSALTGTKLAKLLETEFAKLASRLQPPANTKLPVPETAATEAARARLVELGLRADAHSMCIAGCRSILLPVTIAIYRSRNGERAAAWFDLEARESEALSAVVTRNLLAAKSLLG